jgi:hypothetical protein
MPHSQGGGIARATLSENGGNLGTSYALDRVDDLVAACRAPLIHEN